MARCVRSCPAASGQRSDLTHSTRWPDAPLAAPRNEAARSRRRTTPRAPESGQRVTTTTERRGRAVDGLPPSRHSRIGRASGTAGGDTQESARSDPRCCPAGDRHAGRDRVSLVRLKERLTTPQPVWTPTSTCVPLRSTTRSDAWQPSSYRCCPRVRARARSVPWAGGPRKPPDGKATRLGLRRDRRPAWGSRLLGRPRRGPARRRQSRPNRPVPAARTTCRRLPRPRSQGRWSPRGRRPRPAPRRGASTLDESTS